MRFLFPTKESEYGLILYKHFKKGLELFGHTVDTIHRKDVTVELIKEYDYTFLFTVTTDAVLKKVQDAGGKYIYLDKGYCRNKRLRDSRAYVRISINQWQPLKYLHKFEDRHDRWAETRRQEIRKLRIENLNRSKENKARHFDIIETLEPQPTKQKHEGSYILFAWSSAKYHIWQGIDDPHVFATKVFDELRQYTDRPIIYRPKPTWSAKEPIPGTIYQAENTTKYHDLLKKDLYAVVTHTSNAALEANFCGVPTMVLGDSIAKPISSTQIKDINNIYRPSIKEKQKLGRALSYFQWTLEEIEQGLMWILLKEVFEEELNGS